MLHLDWMYPSLCLLPDTTSGGAGFDRTSARISTVLPQPCACTGQSHFLCRVPTIACKASAVL